MNIQLMNVPTIRDNNSEHKENRCRLNYWTKRFQIINPLLLSEAAGNQSCFISVNLTISMAFNLIHPPIANHIHTTHEAGAILKLAFLAGRGRSTI
jgi:hypothetical protein